MLKSELKSGNQLSVSLSLVLLITAIGTAVFLGLLAAVAWNYVQRNAAQDLLRTKTATIAEQQILIDSLTLTNQDSKQRLAAEHDKLMQKSLMQASKITEQTKLIAQLKLQSKDLSRQLKRKDKEMTLLRRSVKREIENGIAEQNEILRAEQEELTTSRSQLQLESARLQEQEAQITARLGDMEAWEKKKAEFEKLYTNEAKEAVHERRVHELMEQFHRLQVDLDVLNECDKNYFHRYNEAKSILNHIRTYIQSNKMKDDYFFFVISNDSLITAQNRKLCLGI